MAALLEIDRSNTILYCQRWQETVAFYRDRLGLAEAFVSDWFVELRLSDGAYVSVADSARATVASAGGGGLTLSWRVADAAATRERLSAAGLAPQPLRRLAWGGRGFFLHDPEGHRIEVWSPS
ncbi:MAG TPA: VOC family protein [Thermoanaerobaculia bacterium]|nr:VOC family protein [Thermoanaerobaculia bacterium]